MVVVAVGALALIGATGLAIDGGMAAGAYRHAQNAADAGALAAERKEFVNFLSLPPVASTTSSLTGIATTEVQHNGAQLTSLTSGSTPSTVWVPTTSGGMSAQADFSELSTSIPTTPANGLIPAIPGYDLDVISNKAYGTINMKSTVSPSTGSTASAEAESMYYNAPSLNGGTSGRQNCSTSSASYNSGSDTTGTATDCSSGSVPPPLDTIITNSLGTSPTVLASPNADSQVSAANAPSSSPSMNVVSESPAIVNGGVTLAGSSASTVHSDDVVGWNTLTGAAITTANVSANNVNVTSAMVNVSASNLAMSVSVSMGPTDTHPTITPSCSAGTLTFSAGASRAAQGASAAASATGTATVLPDCTVGSLPNISTVTMTAPWYSPSKDYNTACSYNSSAGTWSCSVQACLLRIVESTTNTTICLLQSILGFGVTSASALQPQFAGALSVTAHVPQTTYFMRALGWNPTDPSATGSAAVANVVDESPSAFALSPFGMPNAATIMGGPAGQPQCNFTFNVLLTGCYYYMYGSSMQAYNPCALSSSWQGQLDPSTSGHRVGTTVVASSSTTPVPRTYQGTSYYLEPVFDATSLQVLYYAVFLPVPGHANWGQLVNSVPSLGGPIVTADTGASYMGVTPGAVSIKVVS